MEKKSVKLWSIVLYGITAFLWIIICVLDFVRDTPSLFLRIIHILCALICCVGVFMWICRYRKNQDKET